MNYKIGESNEFGYFCLRMEITGIQKKMSRDVIGGGVWDQYFKREIED